MSMLRRTTFAMALLLLLVPRPVESLGAVDIVPCATSDCRPASVIELGQVKIGVGTTSVQVPILVKDSAGTPLGSDRPGAAAQIGGLALRVRIRPAEMVVAARVRQSGVAEHQPTRFATSPRTADGVSYLVAFDSAGGQPMLSPGSAQTVAVLELTLAPRLPPRMRIELELDPATSVLTNAAGTVEESVANGSLKLINGWIDVR